MLKLNPIASNMTEVTTENAVVLFSYKTPVAALVREMGTEGVEVWHQYRTTKKWSNTTTRHINKWNPKGGAFGLMPQGFFDGLLGDSLEGGEYK